MIAKNSNPQAEMGNAFDTIAEPSTSKCTERGEIATGEVCEAREKRSRDGAKSKENHSTIRYAASSMQGWRLTMEDAHLLAPELTVEISEGEANKVTLKGHSLFAVFDGHGGQFTSMYACKHLLHILMTRREMIDYAKMGNEQQGDVPGIELLKAAIKGAFLDLDEDLRKHYKRSVLDFLAGEMARTRTGDDETRLDANTSRQLEIIPIESDSPEEGGVEVPLIVPASTTAQNKIDRSGSTAVVVILTPRHIICANAGDSRAILVKSEQVLPLSFDHKPTSQVEQSRIVRAGGEVKMKRIDGDLAVSRGLGDFRFKNDTDLRVDQQKVSAKPDLIVNTRDDDTDEFIVLACDGMWDVMESADCAAATQKIFDEGETDIGLVSEELLDMCLDKNSRDNITVCVVALPACRIMSESTRCSKGKCGVKALREKRNANKLSLGVAKNASMVAQAAFDTVSESSPETNDISQKGKSRKDVALPLDLCQLVTEISAVQAPSAAE